MDGDQKKARRTISLRLNTDDELSATRVKGKLCDLAIKVGDKQVFAHKAVLAVVSPYFHTMFTGGFREGESPQTEVDMTDVFRTVDIAETVIHSLYTGTVEVTTDNVCDLIMGYDFLMVLSSQERLKEQLVSIVKHTLSLDTCLDYWAISRYDSNISISEMILDMLQHRFHDYFIYQFDKVFQTFTFSDIGTLFKKDVFKFCNQHQVLEFLSEWLGSSGPSALGGFLELIKKARFSTDGHPIRAMDILARKLRLNNFEDAVITKACEILWSEISKDPFMCDAVDVTKSPPSSETADLSGKWENEVLIAVAPTNNQKTIDAENRLTVYAYLKESRLWLEIGTFYLPDSVSPSTIWYGSWQLFAVGQVIYMLWKSDKLLIEINLSSSITSHFPLPARGSVVMCLQDQSSLYCISENRNTTGRERYVPGDRRTKVIVFRLTCGQWKRIWESKVSASARVMHCWIDTGCLLILRTSGEIYLLPQISTSAEQKEHFISVQNMSKLGGLFVPHYSQSPDQKSLVLTDEGWYYIVEGPPRMRVVVRIPKKLLQPSVGAEQFDSFPVLANPEEEARKSRVARATKIAEICFTSCGSSVFLIACEERDRSSFTESILGNPSVLEHPPPPCDKILAISGGTLDKAVLVKGKPARYTRCQNQEFYNDYFHPRDYYDYDTLQILCALSH